MDFSIINEKLIEERFNSLPNELKEVLESEEAQVEILNLSKAHFLDEEKAQTLQQLVSLALLGFVSPADLLYEFKEKLFLNHDHARALSKELDDLLFNQIKEELRDIYKPIARADVERRKEEEAAIDEVRPVAFNTLPVESDSQEQDNAATLIEIKDEGPKIIQKETSFFERAEPTPGSSKLSGLSFNSFASSSETSEVKPVTAKIQTPQSALPAERIQPPTPRKVVDYTEGATPSATSKPGISSEFVNLGALQKVSLTPTPSMPSSTPTPVPTSPITPATAPSSISIPPPIVPSAPIITPTILPATNPISVSAPMQKSGITSEFSRLSSITKSNAGEKKSPAQWIPTPIAFTPTPDIVKKPIATIKEVSDIIPEPKHIDAIMLNTNNTPSESTTPTPQSPALDGNVIHLKF